MANMKKDGGQGKAAPVNTANPIREGKPTDWENANTQYAGKVAWGEHSGGSGNNDKRAAR